MRVRSCKGGSFAPSVASFVEEAFVRRELSDNFCFYNKNYDNVSGAADWARTTLQVSIYIYVYYILYVSVYVVNIYLLNMQFLLLI